MSDFTDVLERFRRAPEVIALMLTGVFGDEIDFTSAPDKWSIRQIARHLADTELVMSFRFRSIIAEDNPPLPAFNQGLWGSKLDYAVRKPAQSLEHFRRLRADNYELLKGVTPEAFDRKGTHAERGELTLRQVLQIATDHAESHARQLQTIREAYKAAKQTPRPVSSAL
jgi:hypothetical protein